jgi:hypothetical protein
LERGSNGCTSDALEFALPGVRCVGSHPCQVSDSWLEPEFRGLRGLKYAGFVSIPECRVAASREWWGGMVRTEDGRKGEGEVRR